MARGKLSKPAKPVPDYVRAYADVLHDVVTVDVWREIIGKVVEKAKSGDEKARAWLSDYLIGKPVPRAEQPALDDRPIVIEWGDD